MDEGFRSYGHLETAFVFFMHESGIHYAVFRQYAFVQDQLIYTLLAKTTDQYENNINNLLIFEKNQLGHFFSNSFLIVPAMRARKMIDSCFCIQ